MKIPKIKNKAFIIELHLYVNKVFFIYGDFKLLKKVLLSVKNPPTEATIKDIFSCLEKDEINYAGRCLDLDNGDQIIHIHKDVNIFDIIPHEVLHCVNNILKDIGMGKLDKSTQEAYCYLNGYINKKIFEQL